MSIIVFDGIIPSNTIFLCEELDRWQKGKMDGPKKKLLVI